MTWRLDRRDAGIALHLRDELLDGPGTATADRQLDRTVPERWEVGAHHVVHLAGARAPGQDLGVDRGEPDLQERDAEGDQRDGAYRRDRDGPAHHEAGQAVPEALLRRGRVALGAPLQELRRQRVHPRPEDAEHGRQDHERDAGGEEGDERAADSHRVQEPLREDDQRGESGRDRERGEQHRPAGGPHRRAQRLPALSASARGNRVDAPPRELLAVAGDDEQAVVDRQPEPQTGGQVQREDRDRADLAGDSQDEERPHDRQTADQERQKRRDQAPEEEQRKQEEQRESEHLGAAQVGLGLLVHLFLGQRLSPDRHTRLSVQLVGDARRRVLLSLVVGRPQRNRDVGRVAVVRDEVVRSRVVVARDALDLVALLQLALDRLDALLGLRLVHRSVLDQDDHRCLPVAVRLEQAVGLDALGGGVIRPVGIEVARDRASESARDDEEHNRAERNPSSAPVDETCEPIEHQAVLLRFESSVSSSRIVRLHHCACQRLHSIPYRST